MTTPQKKNGGLSDMDEVSGDRISELEADDFRVLRLRHAQVANRARRVVDSLIRDLQVVTDKQQELLRKTRNLDARDAKDIARAVTLGNRAGAARDLMNALKTSIELERATMGVEGPGLGNAADESIAEDGFDFESLTPEQRKEARSLLKALVSKSGTGAN